MRARVRRLLRGNTLYGVVFTLLVLLGAWWTVLIARLVEENHALQLSQPVPAAQAHAEYRAKRRMLLGESVTMTALLVALFGGAVAQARRERAQARRLEDVLAASTHELKTPVAGVKALLESLRSGVLPPERMGPYVERGLESTARLEHLVESIVAYQAAVVRSGATEVRTLDAWIAPILEHRRSTVPGEPIEVALGPCAPVATHATQDGLRVILENLFDNARKYGAGSTIRVGARRHDDLLLLDVTDEGAGFEAEDAERLFEPYQRTAAAERRHGTGLGLYISRMLARSMGGDLHARSPGPGRGSTFTLALRAG